MSRILGIAGLPRWSFPCLFLASLALALVPSLAQEAKKDEPRKDEAKKQFVIAAGLDLTPSEKSQLARVTHG